MDPIRLSQCSQPRPWKFDRRLRAASLFHPIGSACHAAHSRYTLKANDVRYIVNLQHTCLLIVFSGTIEPLHTCCVLFWIYGLYHAYEHKFHSLSKEVRTDARISTRSSRNDNRPREELTIKIRSARHELGGRHPLPSLECPCREKNIKHLRFGLVVPPHTHPGVSTCDVRAVVLTANKILQTRVDLTKCGCKGVKKKANQVERSSSSFSSLSESALSAFAFPLPLPFLP